MKALATLVIGLASVIARRKADKWYIGGVSAEPMSVKVDLSPFGGKSEQIELKKNDGFWRILNSKHEENHK